jgi:hypothetical protein
MAESFLFYIYLFSFDPWQDRDPFQDLFVHGRTGLSGRFSTFISTAPTSESLVLVEERRRILSHQKL